MKAVIVFFGLLTHAIACESVYIPSCEMGSRFNQVFVGTAIEERLPGVYRFAVDEPLKGFATGTNGQPAGGIMVQFVDAIEDPAFPPEAKTDEKGRFEFRNLPPGDYLLGVNVTGVNSRLPYESRFYPDASNRSGATPIRIDGAQTIDGLDFRIDEPLPTRRIEIDVIWPDRRPVANAQVDCRGELRDFVSRYVDQGGKATCVVLAKEDFNVEADRLSWKASDRPIQPIATRPRFRVPAGTDTVHLTFVVDAVNDISATEAPENMAAFNDRGE